MATAMSGKRKTESDGLKCLICGADTLHAHSGIDACRACSVFFKRTITREHELVCINGDGNCGNRGTIVSCRKCRLDRFKEVYDRASEGEIACEVERRGGSTEEFANELPHFLQAAAQKDDGYSDSESNAFHMDDPGFIDHTSTPNNEPTRDNTPLLNGMKLAYRKLCQSRKAGEMCVLHHMAMHEQIKRRTTALRPTKYSDMIPYSHIFFAAMFDFAEESFADFKEMPLEEQHSLTEANFELILAIDNAYRSHHNFPNNTTVMGTYLTYVSEDTLKNFFDDCPSAVNKDAAFEQFRKNMKETTILAKIEMGKLNPSIDEFLVLFAFALWNDYTCSLNTETGNLVKKNREGILRELKIVYSQKGCVEFSPRMGELLCLLTEQERVVEQTKVDVHIYRMMDLFNEAYEDEKK